MRSQKQKKYELQKKDPCYKKSSSDEFDPTAVKLGDKERFDKEQIGDKEHFTDYQPFYNINLLFDKELLSI